jgi:hypothetical protein
LGDGCISRGFDFLGYRCSAEGIVGVAEQTASPPALADCHERIGPLDSRMIVEGREAS